MSKFSGFFLIASVLGFGCAEPTDTTDTNTADTEANIMASLETFAAPLPAPPRRNSILVSASSTMPRDNIILGDSTGNFLDAFALHTFGEGVTIAKVCLVNTGSAVDAISEVEVMYEDSAGEMATNRSVMASRGRVCFSGMDMVLPERGMATLFVYADTAPDATPGSTVQFNWTDIGVEAYGESGRVYTARNVTDLVLGATMTYHVTKPTFSSVAGSGGEGIPGFYELLPFNMAANSRGYVGIDQIPFGINASDEARSGWTTCFNLGRPEKWDFFDTTDLSEAIDASWTFTADDGTDCEDSPDRRLASGTVTLFDEEVAAGSTNRYSLEVDTTGASSAMDDSVMAYIKGDSVDSIWWFDDDHPVAFNGTDIDTMSVRVTTIY